MAGLVSLEMLKTMNHLLLDGRVEVFEFESREQKTNNLICKFLEPICR